MASANVDVETVMNVLELLDELIDRQRRKVREIARRLRPGLADEDLRNVHGFPDVHRDPTFRFEDGQLAGLVAAHLALQARLRGARVAQG